MTETEPPRARRAPADVDATPRASLHIGAGPITAPIHSWFTSPARSHPNAAQAKELPLHLIQLILAHLDDVGDLARVTRTSRLFYYMTLPRLYEQVTLRSYSEIRYTNGKPEGYGGGSPFAMGLNTLVSRPLADYVQRFRVIGDWREHDMNDYKQGRVPDKSMVLQIVMRAALDKMKNLTAFAWELNTPPLHTVYQGLVNKQPGLTSLTIRCPTTRIPRPTTIIPPLPNLATLVVYDIDPLCYPDDVSLLLVGSKKLENLKLHWNPRMRGSGEESVNLLTLFGRCVAARHAMPLKRLAIYNLYTRFAGDSLPSVIDQTTQTEVTIINSMKGSSHPMTVFVDDAWRIHNNKYPIPSNLKMFRTDNADKEGATLLGKFKGLERLYIVNDRVAKVTSKPASTISTPTTPSTATPGMTNGATSANGTPKINEQQCRSIGSEYLAVIQTNHRTMRHLLLSDKWQISDDALFRICQSCPNLEQLGFSCLVPPLESLRQVIAMVPKLWAIRMMIDPNFDSAEATDAMNEDMHTFAIATEFWRPEYRNLRYVSLGDELVWKLGGVWFPPKWKDKGDNTMNARRAGPIRRAVRVSRESLKHIEIWSMDSMEFDASFP